MAISRKTISPFDVLKTDRLMVFNLHTIREKDFAEDEVLRDTIREKMEEDALVFKDSEWQECKNIRFFRLLENLEYNQRLSSENDYVIIKRYERTSTQGETHFEMQIGSFGCVISIQADIHRTGDVVVRIEKLDQDFEGGDLLRQTCALTFTLTANPSYNDEWRLRFWRFEYVQDGVRNSIGNLSKFDIRILDEKFDLIHSIFDNVGFYFGGRLIFKYGAILFQEESKCHLQYLEDKEDMKALLSTDTIRDLSEEPLMAQYLFERMSEELGDPVVDNYIKIAPNMPLMRFFYASRHLSDEWSLFRSQIEHEISFILPGQDFCATVLLTEEDDSVKMTWEFVRSKESLRVVVHIGTKLTWNCSDLKYHRKKSKPKDLKWGDSWTVNELEAKPVMVMAKKMFSNLFEMNWCSFEGKLFPKW